MESNQESSSTGARDEASRSQESNQESSSTGARDEASRSQESNQESSSTGAQDEASRSQESNQESSSTGARDEASRSQESNQDSSSTGARDEASRSQAHGGNTRAHCLGGTVPVQPNEYSGTGGDIDLHPGIMTSVTPSMTAGRTKEILANVKGYERRMRFKYVYPE